MSEHAKRRLLVAFIILSLLPSLLLLHTPTTISLASVSLYISAVIGYMAIVQLLWMYILGTRAVTSLFFVDIAPILVIHKWLGKYGTIAILLHPLLIIYSYGESLLYSVIPLVNNQIERHITLGRIAFWVMVLTWVVSAFLRDKISFRPWKYLHYLAYICIPFALLHVPDLGSQEQAHPLVKAYLFILGLVFVLFTFLRLRSIFNLDKKSYAVVEHILLTKVDHLMRLRPLTRSLKTPKLGQFVYIKLGFISEDHPFSVTRFDAKTDEVTVAYRQFGMFSKVLSETQVGTPVLLSGPFGSFTSELTSSDANPVVYIAGGIGITPFVERILGENTVREQWLFAINRSRETAVMVAPLKKQLGERCIGIYNHETSPLVRGEESGYITHALLTKYLDDPTRFHYYLCGPPAMIAGLREVIESIGVTPSNIRSEKFGW